MLRNPIPLAMPRAQALGVTCRLETDGDRPFLLGLYATTRAEELAMTDWPEATKSLFVLQQFSAQHGDYIRTRPGLLRLIVERTGVAIGRVYLDFPGPTCHLVDISLMPGARQKGIGTAMIGDLIDHARKQAKPVTLSVIPNNPAKALYARLGFLETGRSGHYHHMAWTPPAR